MALARKPEAPRTDLPPERKPYCEGHFGTDEEGVERERDAGPSPAEEEEDAARRAAEDAAGGDREIS
ncbi:MAG TPA: hypothetical protein VIV57_05165 [Anaeromyxobacter sp.]